jgi:hypothetical protein
MALYIRNFPEPLLRQAKAKAALAGQTLHEWMVEVVSLAVARATAKPEVKRVAPTKSV